MDENLGLIDSEYQSVDEYLKQSKTSVLTILFTDIAGYTEYTDKNGDAKSNEIRKIHDDIMIEEIEKKYNGKIIKFIGDAVMAIFSEPSSGAQACVEIQRKMLHLYETGKFPLKVRMGLHLGQVTIEQKIGHDIFGRHVNKASRVESMAAGGQIYASYSVTETLKGNIEIEGVDFFSHGFVKAKGISEKFEIFEVLFLRSQKARAPIGTKEKILKPKVLVSILVLIIIAIFAAYKAIYPKLFLYRAPQVPLVLNHKSILNLKNVDNQSYKEIHEKIPLGEHFVYYQVSSVVRYYAPLKVNFSSEFIKPKYRYFSLPAIENQLNLSNKVKVESHKETLLEYDYITADFNIVKKKVNFKSYQVIEKTDKGSKAKIEFEFIGPQGKVIKNTFEKFYKKGDSSFRKRISVLDQGEHRFGIGFYLWETGLKITYRIDFRNLEEN